VVEGIAVDVVAAADERVIAPTFAW